MTVESKGPTMLRAPYLKNWPRGILAGVKHGEDVGGVEKMGNLQYWAMCETAGAETGKDWNGSN